MQFFGYLALGIWMRPYSALWTNIMIVGAAMIYTFGLAHHILGCAAEWIYIKSDHKVTSNRESGEGRYDIQMMPRKPEDPGFIFELKAEKNAEQDKLKTLADQALRQIAEKKYAEEMRSQGADAITQYGVAFSGKHVEIMVLES